VFRARLEKPPEQDAQAAVGEFVGQFSNPSLRWDDLDHLRSETELPILVKGVLHADDAREARERGVDGVVVSNHGGRQVDGAIASLDALPAIVDAVGDQLTVILDSGVRSGSDVAKAIALGADAAFVGRPYLWGLALGGEQGVVAVLRAMLAELDLTVGLTGHTSPAELDRDLLVRAS
jgi:lactate 2-monooxygenase